VTTEGSGVTTEGSGVTKDNRHADEGGIPASEAARAPANRDPSYLGVTTEGSGVTKDNRHAYEGGIPVVWIKFFTKTGL